MGRIDDGDGAASLCRIRRMVKSIHGHGTQGSDSAATLRVGAHQHISDAFVLGTRFTAGRRNIITSFLPVHIPATSPLFILHPFSIII